MKCTNRTAVFNALALPEVTPFLRDKETLREKEGGGGVGGGDFFGPSILFVRGGGWTVHDDWTGWGGGEVWNPVVNTASLC